MTPRARSRRILRRVSSDERAETSAKASMNVVIFI